LSLATDGIEPLNRKFNWVLSSLYHRPMVSIADVFTKILVTWIPPPAKILDPTAGPRRMYERLMNQTTLEGYKYDFTFGDIEPQAPDILKMDARELPMDYSGMFDGLIVDPPYNRDLRLDRKKIQAYKGSREFDLKDFIDRSYDDFLRVLKPKGRLIFKIGDNHRKVGDDWILESWHVYVINLYSKDYVHRDLVVHGPWHKHLRWAPKKPYSMQRHSYFLLFEKKY
jgi:hypothetical protein